MHHQMTFTHIAYCLMVFRNIKLLNYINEKCVFPCLGVMQLCATVSELKKKNSIVIARTAEKGSLVFNLDQIFTVRLLMKLLI